MRNQPLATKQWNDDEFCRDLGFNEGVARRLCQKIREITAEQCNTRKELIGPALDTRTLADRTLSGWDEDALLMSLEHEFKFKKSVGPNELPNFTLRRFFWFFKQAAPRNYGEWVKETVSTLIPFLES